MADTVLKTATFDLMMSEDDAPAARRSNRELTKDDIKYLRKIEELANERLRFFRDRQKLLEEELKKEEEEEERRMKKRKKSKAAMSSSKKRPPMITGREVDHHHDHMIRRKKVVKKVVRTPVVSNEITERLKYFIENEIHGTDIQLVIQKTLYESDTKKSQNRLNMPINQLEIAADFLTEDEKRLLHNKKMNPKENEIEVQLLGPTLEMFCLPMKLTMWHMASTVNYVLKSSWHKFWSENEEHLQINSKIQVWSFRRGDQLCFAVICVGKPDDKEDDVA